MPLEQRELEGNRGKRPMPKKLELTPASSRTPEFLSGEAAKWYKLVSSELRQVGILKAVDMPELCMAAQAYANVMEAIKGLAATGGGVVMVGDKPQISPYDVIFRQNAALYTQITSNFGLNPADRSRIAATLDTTPPSPQEETLRDLIERSSR